jgi:hypothetical protein
VSVSFGRQGQVAPTQPSEPRTPRRWGSLVFTTLALVGSFHALMMLGVEVGRLIYTNREVVRLEREVSVLEAETSELAAIVAHKNDPVFREQLARQQGFIGPDETRILTRMP